MFDQDDLEQECIKEYNLGQISLKIKSKSMHIGVSRSVWKASLALAQYLNTNSDNFDVMKEKQLQILELGSGPGLSGFYASRYFKDSKVFLTDICIKSLNLIKENIDINKEVLNQNQLSVDFFEWGNFTRSSENEEHYQNKDEFPTNYEGQFDLVIASDVVYIPEFLDPLLKSIQYFIKPQSGRCLLVNNKIRQDLFIDKFDQMLLENKLDAFVNEEFDMDEDKFRVFIMRLKD
ncbi:UNKNOWN [Stylonychia lemnae]|uniref:Uncharacterized protein n=1 Tax=Stylonychia lemnae TaxID=5949 RepID=A0A078ASC3_STYLE|nr:UNKNOWN [Stylonychia lemnae]|eukprot:CDW84866.1 UNKNOWN [Stylonychia lemnae]